jgi:hypothetical protein
VFPPRLSSQGFSPGDKVLLKIKRRGSPFGARILEEYEYQTMLQGDISSKLNVLVSKLITQETLCLHKLITK